MRLQKIMLLPLGGLMVFLHVNPILARTDAECERLYGITCNHHEDELRQQQLQRQPPVQAPDAVIQPPEYYRYAKEAGAALERGDLHTALINIRRVKKVEIFIPSTGIGTQVLEQLLSAAIAEPYIGYIRLGDKFISEGYRDIAVTMYRHALKYNPNRSEARQRLSQIR